MQDYCKSVPHTSFEREMLGMRLEQAVYALHQILSLAVHQNDSESEAFLCELLRNDQLLHIKLSGPESSTQCIHWGFVVHGAFDGFSRWQ